MRIAVFGAGGVGGYFGGRLAQAGEDVVFVARGEHLRAMKEQGLRVDSLEGDFMIHPVQATDDPTEIGIVDTVLVGVKAWQVAEVAKTMRPMIGPDTFVVPLQNGVEAASQLTAVLGSEHVLGGLCGIVTSIVAPGHIRHVGIEPFVKFGELNNRPSKRVEKLRQAFAHAEGVTAEVPSNIEVAIWEKFMVISAWSGVGAVTRAPMGIIRSEPTRQMLKQAVQEVYDVAQVRNVGLSPESVTKVMTFFDGLPDAATASMQRDILNGRPSELEMQNGAIVRLGLEAGVATPANTFIYHSLLPMERRARGELQFSE